MLRDEGKPTKEQQRIIFQCDILTRSLAKVGITALVDEATGYQFDRQRDELQQILAAYVAEELRPWVRAFPEEFFKQVHRIYDWSYPPKGAKHPRYMGKFINKYIYDRLPPGVHEELRNRNPSDEKGYRKHKHHQFLTDETGVSHLDRQIVQVVTVLKVSKTKEDFEANAKRLFDEEEPTLF